MCGVWLRGGYRVVVLICKQGMPFSLVLSLEHPIIHFIMILEKGCVSDSLLFASLRLCFCVSLFVYLDISLPLCLSPSLFQDLFLSHSLLPSLSLSISLSLPSPSCVSYRVARL